MPECMSTLDRYGYTDVYADGTIVCGDRNLPRKEIPKEEMHKKKLLFRYHFAGPDHPYANANNDWLELKFEERVTISQLKKIVDNPDLDPEAKKRIEYCIAQNKVEST